MSRRPTVGGIGPVWMGRVSRARQEQKEIRGVVVFLQGHGVSSAYAVRIYKACGDRAVLVVREDPYRLVPDISGIVDFG